MQCLQQLMISILWKKRHLSTNYKWEEKNFKNTKTQEFSDENQSETIKKRNNTTSKFKKTNSVATQNFEEISRRGTHQSEDMATKERTKPVTRDETKRDILKITKSTANKIAMINKKSLHTKRASMGCQKLDCTEPEEKTYIVSCKEYVKKRKFDKRDFLINRHQINTKIDRHFYKQFSNDIQLAVSTENSPDLKEYKNQRKVRVE